MARKTTLARGAQADLERVVREQQIKNREEMEKILASVKAKHKEGQVRDEKTLTRSGRDDDITAVNGAGKGSGAAKDKSNGAKASGLSQTAGSSGSAHTKNSSGDGPGATSDVSGCVRETEAQIRAGDPKSKRQTRGGQADFDKVTGKVDLTTMHFHGSE